MEGAEGIYRENILRRPETTASRGQSALHPISSSNWDPTPCHSSLVRKLKAEVSLNLAVLFLVMLQTLDLEHKKAHKIHLRPLNKTLILKMRQKCVKDLLPIMVHTDFVTMGKFLNISELRIFIVNKYILKKKNFLAYLL